MFLGEPFIWVWGTRTLLFLLGQQDLLPTEPSLQPNAGFFFKNLITNIVAFYLKILCDSDLLHENVGLKNYDLSNVLIAHGHANLNFHLM